MTQLRLFRFVLVLAGLMGAVGVALAAAAAHQPDATRLAAASSMLLFHAPAVLAAVTLVERGLLQRNLGVVSIVTFVAGATLFAADLAARQYLGHGLFPMAAPAGGTLLIASWLILALAAAWPRRAQ